ncbi:unnamed protein product [Parajaminaea phylloscopi]
MASSMASSSRLTPLTPATSSPSETPRDAHVSSYAARMGSLSRSSSTSSSVCSSRRGSHSAASSAKPVVRGGFIIPAITLTPPDDKPRRSASLPWQDFTSKRTLYVPVKTEEIGWEEGGLWWHGKFHYREVLLYGGQDDHVVGKYRGGPDGYRYQEVWDQAGLDHQVPRKIDEPAPQKPKPSVATSPSSSASAKKSSSSTDSVRAHRRSSEDSASSATSSRSASASSRRSSSMSSDSAASSRRASESTVDTAVTSPCDTPVERLSMSTLSGKSYLDAESSIVESPVECGPGGEPFARLEAALLALRAQKDADAMAATTAQMAGKLRPGQSLTLSEDGPSASHQWPKGRGFAKVADTPSSAASRAAPLSGKTVGSRATAPLHPEHELHLGYSC